VQLALSQFFLEKQNLEYELIAGMRGILFIGGLESTGVAGPT